MVVKTLTPMIVIVEVRLHPFLTATSWNRQPRTARACLSGVLLATMRIKVKMSTSVTSMRMSVICCID